MKFLICDSLFRDLSWFWFSKRFFCSGVSFFPLWSNSHFQFTFQAQEALFFIPLPSRLSWGLHPPGMTLRPILFSHLDHHLFTQFNHYQVSPFCPWTQHPGCFFCKPLRRFIELRPLFDRPETMFSVLGSPFRYFYPIDILSFLKLIDNGKSQLLSITCNYYQLRFLIKLTDW